MEARNELTLWIQNDESIARASPRARSRWCCASTREKHIEGELAEQAMRGSHPLAVLDLLGDREGGLAVLESASVIATRPGLAIPSMNSANASPARQSIRCANPHRLFPGTHTRRRLRRANGQRVEVEAAAAPSSSRLDQRRGDRRDRAGRDRVVQQPALGEDRRCEQPAIPRSQGPRRHPHGYVQLLRRSASASWCRRNAIARRPSPPVADWG